MGCKTHKIHSYFFQIIMAKITFSIINQSIIVNLKSASNLNGNLNCSKELEHYAS